MLNLIGLIKLLTNISIISDHLYLILSIFLSFFLALFYSNTSSYTSTFFLKFTNLPLLTHWSQFLSWNKLLPSFYHIHYNSNIYFILF